MASRYIQKYPIPEQFPLLLKNFTRELLRDQPPNIIEYSAKYFEALQKGQAYDYSSPYNVPKSQQQYHLSHDQRKAAEMVKKDLRINQLSGSLSKKESQRIKNVIDHIFEKYDSNKDGQLSTGELKSMIKDLYKGGLIDVIPPEQSMNAFILQMDSNYNGKIDKEEMTGFIRQTFAA